MATNSENETVGSQPNSARAREASPTRRSTSAGRRNRSSMITCSAQSRPTWLKASSQRLRTEWVWPVATTKSSGSSRWSISHMART